MAEPFKSSVCSQRVYICLFSGMRPFRKTSITGHIWLEFRRSITPDFTGTRPMLTRFLSWIIGFWMGVGLLMASAGTARAGVINFSPLDDLAKVGRTISKVLPGSQIHLSPGIYHGTLRISRAKGISTNPVRVMGSKGTVIDARNPDRINRDGYGQHGILIENSAHVILQNIEIQGAERGITIGNGMDISILDCHIHDIRNYGIMNYKSSGSHIVGNHISRSLKEHGIYISGQAHDIQIRENIIEDTHINGIHCNGKISSLVIERNQLHRIGTYPSKEGGAAVTLINGASDALIRNNLFVHIYGQGLTVAGQRIRIINNVFHDVAWSIILGIQGASHIAFFNNIIIGKKAVPFQIHRGALASFACDYNYYCMNKQPFYESQGIKMRWKQWRGKKFDSHSVRGDIPFPGVSPISDSDNIISDYRLNSSSSAIDGGMPELEDAAIPPGRGGIRSDMGIFGGPSNRWQ